MRALHSTALSKMFALIMFTMALPAMAAEVEFREEFIDIGHARLNAFVWDTAAGNSETIIALPGSGSDVVRYRYIAPQLAEAGYRVIAVNQRGIMGSTGELEGLTLHSYAADIIAVMGAVGVNKIHMMGWALGNRISRTVATDYPDKVASVTLLAAGGLARPKTEPGTLAALLGEPELPFEEKVRLARHTLFSPTTPNELVEEAVRNLNYWPEGRAAQRSASRNTPVEEYAAGGSSDILIIQGLDDLTAPPENGEIMKQRYGNRITLTNLEGAGHWMGVEKPRETVAAIVTFLRRHPID